MAKYKLVIGSVADRNLFDLFRDGVRRWGLERANSYYDAFYTHFDGLRDNPFMYQAVPEIREGYRRSLCGKHAVYYRVNGGTIEIMAVLRYQDPTEFFSGD